MRTAAHGDIAEVMICMFGPTSDRYGLLHRGTRCRKMHSSYRSTFRTIGDIPLATVSRDAFTYLTKDFRRRDRSRKVRVDAVYDDRTTILYYYPGMKPDLVDALVEKGYRGIVIAATGLGHVNKPLYPALKRAAAANVHVVMTVQTLWGYAQMYVYDTGRDLLDIGVVPLDNMLPETAFMKLCWVLGHTDDHGEVLRMMRDPITHEIIEREPHNGYVILQRGLPETEEFITTHWRVHSRPDPLGETTPSSTRRPSASSPAAVATAASASGARSTCRAADPTVATAGAAATSCSGPTATSPR